MNEPAKCSKCDEPILWCATVNGKMQPLDLAPNPDGNIVLTKNFRPTERGVLQECRVLTKAEREPGLFTEDTEERFMPHHATCPFAYEFRRKAPAS